MSIEEFDNLDKEGQRVIIFEAEKVAGMNNYFTKTELFFYQDLFIETKISMINNFKRIISTYTLTNLPFHYADLVQNGVVKN
jgi:hypothetical protein